MGFGSFISGLGHAVGGALGISGNRNNAAADAATKSANANNMQLYSDWQNQNNQHVAQNNQLANTNYMAGAQNVYGQQQGAAQMLYNQAAGNVPSASQLQMYSGLANANNQVNSAALANQGGMNPGATQRNLLNAQANQDASIVSNGMATRAQEQAQQQQAYGNLLGTMQNQQQQMGQFQYGQGQNALNYNTTASNNALNLGQHTQQLNLGNTTGAINADAQANAAQAGAMGNTLTAIATQGASLVGPKAQAAS